MINRLINRKELGKIFTIAIICILSIITYSYFCVSLEENVVSAELCEAYANEMVVASRYSMESGVREYSIQGVWYEEELLMESCKGK